MKVTKRGNPKDSHDKKNFFSLILYLHEMMDVHQIYSDNHVSEIIILYILTLHSALCQLYLNKTDRKKQFFKKTTYHQNSIKDKRDHLNSPINIKKKKIDSIVQNSGKRNSQAQMASLENFTKNLKN